MSFGGAPELLNSVRCDEAVSAGQLPEVQGSVGHVQQETAVVLRHREGDDTVTLLYHCEGGLRVQRGAIRGPQLYLQWGLHLGQGRHTRYITKKAALHQEAAAGICGPVPSASSVDP